MSTPLSRSSRHLYRSVQRAARGFEDYNFRAYFVRRSREDWRADTSAAAASKDFLADQKQHLQMLRRQGALSQLYPSPRYLGEDKGDRGSE